MAGERWLLTDTQPLERAPSQGGEGKAHGVSLLLLGLPGALLLSLDVPQPPSQDRIGREGRVCHPRGPRGTRDAACGRNPGGRNTRLDSERPWVWSPERPAGTGRLTPGGTYWSPCARD